MINSGIQLKIQSETMLFPKRSTFFSAGYDIFAPHEVTINPYSEYTLDLPFSFTSEEGELSNYEIMIVVRSSYGLKKDLRIVNTKGEFVTHESYNCGEVSTKVILYNDKNEQLIIPKDEHFLQFIITKKKDALRSVSFENVSEEINSSFPSSGFSIEQKHGKYLLKTNTKILVSPNRPFTFPIGLKAKFEDGEWLGATVNDIYKKQMIFANLTPVIDADYYNNPKNEGLIFVGLVNITDEELVIKEHSVICEFWAKPFYLLSNEVPPEQSRSGGIGSTTDKSNK